MERRDQPEAKTEAEVVDAFRKGTNFHHLSFVKKQKLRCMTKIYYEINLASSHLIINTKVFPSFK
jgi:hypothetical protein